MVSQSLITLQRKEWIISLFFRTAWIYRPLFLAPRRHKRHLWMSRTFFALLKEPVGRCQKRRVLEQEVCASPDTKILMFITKGIECMSFLYLLRKLIRPRNACSAERGYSRITSYCLQGCTKGSNCELNIPCFKILLLPLHIVYKPLAR